MRNLILLTLLAAASGAASSYHIVDLGAAGVDAYAINESRQVVVYKSNVTVIEFTVWDNGVVTPLPATAFGNGNNARGQVVGTYFPTVWPKAFVWDRGVLTSLALPPGASATQGLAINNRGQAVGHVSGPDAVLHALVWENGTFSRLPEGPTGQASVAKAISDSGVIVGYVQVKGVAQPAVWDHGQLTILALPPELPPSAGGFAFDVNNRGDILLWLGPWQYLWSKGTYTRLPLSVAAAINDAGAIACNHSVIGPPCVWENGVITDLPTLGGSQHAARAINSHGDVAGFSTDTKGVGHAVMWVRQ